MWTERATNSTFSQRNINWTYLQSYALILCIFPNKRDRSYVAIIHSFISATVSFKSNTNLMPLSSKENLSLSVCVSLYA